MTPRSQAPRIAIRTDDYEKLSAMASAAGSEPVVARYLADELGRAEIVAPDQIGDDVVTMNTALQFRDEATGQIRQVTLVYPEEADILAGRLSVMTPVGAALIGLAVGDSIEWETRDGQSRTLTVLSVSPPTAKSVA